jgi:hypothetical protein
VLEALGMVENKKICSCPPTFVVKNKRAIVKKKCSSFFHGDLGMVETNLFALSLLLLASQVKGREQKNYLRHALSS